MGQFEVVSRIGSNLEQQHWRSERLERNSFSQVQTTHQFLPFASLLFLPSPPLRIGLRKPPLRLVASTSFAFSLSVCLLLYSN